MKLLVVMRILAAGAVLASVATSAVAQDEMDARLQSMQEHADNAYAYVNRALDYLDDDDDTACSYLRQSRDEVIQSLDDIDAVSDLIANDDSLTSDERSDLQEAIGEARDKATDTRDLANSKIDIYC